MNSNPALSIPEEMPAEYQNALKQVHSAVEQLHRDHEATIRDMAFERAAELRERADVLKRQKERIMSEWERSKARLGGAE